MNAGFFKSELISLRLGAVVYKCSLKHVLLKLSKFYRKTPVLDSLFNNEILYFFVKKKTLYESKICKIFKKNVFYRTPLVAASARRIAKIFTNSTNMNPNMSFFWISCVCLFQCHYYGKY